MSEDLQFPPPPPTDDPSTLHIYGCLKVIDMKVDRLEGWVGRVEGKVRIHEEERQQLRGAVRLASLLGWTGLAAGLAAVWHFFTGQPAGRG